MGFLDDMKDEVREWLPSNDETWLAGVDLFEDVVPQVSQQEQYLYQPLLQQGSFDQVTQQFGTPSQCLGHTQQNYGQPATQYPSQTQQGYGQFPRRYQSALAYLDRPAQPSPLDLAETLGWDIPTFDSPTFDSPPPVSNTDQPPSLTSYQANTFAQQETSQDTSRPSSVCQRRGAMVPQINTNPLSNTPIAPRRDAISEPADPLANATQVEMQVLRNIAGRLQAQGTPINIEALDAGLIAQLFQTYATAQERAAFEEEQAGLVAELANTDKAQAETQAEQRSKITRTSEEAWFDDYRRQLSPGRQADGVAKPPEGQVTYEQVTTYDRLQLQKSCVDCRREKRKCDRKDTANHICTGCVKKEVKYRGKYIASEMCYPEASEAYREFVDDRAAYGGKAVRTDSGWQSKRYRGRKGREDAKKAAKEQ